MSAHRRGRRGRRGHAGEHENEERWLLTYSDMITLLMALFMVLFSISSVNISKYKSLQLSLQDAFSGRILKAEATVLPPAVLENLSAPSTLGPSISSAFIATLYGVGSANVVFLPVANKLKYLSALEQDLGYMTVEGILAIQAGDNPRVVESKLMSYVSPEEREAEPGEQGAQAPVGEAAAAAA